MTDHQLWTLAAATLTHKEHEVYRLHHRHNLSERQIALALDLSRSSIRSRLENADRKMAIAIRDHQHAA